MSITDVALAKESTSLGRGGWGRRVLDLGGGGCARLAHGVGAVHFGGGKKLSVRMNRFEQQRQRCVDLCYEELDEKGERWVMRSAS